MTTLLQGNYSFIDGLFDLLEESDGPFNEALKNELKIKIIEVTSTLDQYENIVNDLTVDEEFLNKSPEERVELFSDFRLSLNNLIGELTLINNLIERLGLTDTQASYESKIERLDTRLSNLTNKIEGFKLTLEELEAELVNLEEESKIEAKTRN